MSDVIIDRVDVVEIYAPAHSVTEVTGTATAGLVEVMVVVGDLLTVPEPVSGVLDLITPGPIGPRGPQGIQGPQGPFAPVFEQFFASPMYEWAIHHNLDVPAIVVTTVDLNGDEIEGDVTMPDRNTVIVDFLVPFAGTAFLKA